MNPSPSRQSGSTLVISMIILLLMAMHALTSFNLGKNSLQILDNMQQRNQAQAAAQEALDNVISHTTFTSSPGAVFSANNCPDTVSTPANSMCVDVNGDGKTVVVATLTPQPVCVRAATVRNSSLNLSNPEDAGCTKGAAQTLGIVGSASSDSLCADSLWEINVQASEPVSETQVTVTEGAAIRVSTDSIAAFCP